MKKIILMILIILLIAIVVIVILSHQPKTLEQPNSNFKIVTSFYPIYIMTSNLVQDAQNVELVNMTETNIGCLHDYTLMTADMRKIESADVFIQNGLGLESFMEEILSVYSDLKVIDTSVNITNKIEEEGHANAHIWTSIPNYISQINEIAEKLSEYNPENADVYSKNVQDYTVKLEELNQKYQTELTNLTGQKAVCLNEAFTYLLEDIGLELINVETDHEESTLSADTLKNIIHQMQEENIQMIFVAEEDNQQNANTLANETGAKIYSLNTAMTGKLEPDAYIKAMEENLEVLKQINTN